MEAAKNSPDAIKSAAKQFEAVMMQMMMKSMRDASFGDPIFGSSQMDTYTEMFHQQLALTMSKNSGIGLAESIERQLQRYQHIEPDTDTESRPLSGYQDNAVRSLELLQSLKSSIGNTTGNKFDSVLSGMDLADDSPDAFESPRAFVQAILPHAKQVANELGIHLETLVAQAALETGWGQHIIKLPNGNSSLNLFGIKADDRWTGLRASSATLEFINGIMTRGRASFRAYDSIANSFSDYASFLKGNSRYNNALSNASSPYDFLKGLQQAGYATDPSYAEKIYSILQSDTLEDSLGYSLKNIGTILSRSLF